MNLKRYMAKNNLTASSMAERSSVPVQCITRFLRGERGLSLESAIKISEATNGGVSIKELSLSQQVA